MEKNILIFCCGYPWATDMAFGYQVSKVLEKMKLPDNVELMEVGGSACMAPAYVEGMDKFIVVDIFKVDAKPGTAMTMRSRCPMQTVSGRPAPL